MIAMFSVISAFVLAAALPSDSVSPMIGTGMLGERGNEGSTCPGPVWPHGMVQPGPDTVLEGTEYQGKCSGYDPRATTLLGFTQTHLSGTGCPDLQDFLLLPFTGAYPTNSPKRIVARMDKQSETARAGYYAVELPDFGVRAELTASRRAAYYRFTYRKGGPAHVFFDCQAGSRFDWALEYNPNQPQHRVVYSESSAKTNGVVEAYNRVTCWNWEREIFARFEFEPKPVRVTEVPRNRKCGKRYVLDFDLPPGGQVWVRAAISSVDEEGARKNLAAEPAGFDFDARRAECRGAWDGLLSRAEVSGSELQRRLFYTALYHAHVQPTLFSDVDGRCRFQDLARHARVVNRIHSSGTNETYTTFSTWDTYRAAHPLYTILTPSLAGDFAESMLAWHAEMGKLPQWQMFGGENYCMPGPHAVTIVADALVKGLLRTSPAAVYRAIEDSFLRYRRTDDPDGFWRKYYDRLGYLPCDKTGASVSTTLEWGMLDYAAMRVAELAGRTAEASAHRRRAQNYRKLYDAESGLMRGRRADGSWRTPFEPYRQVPAPGEWNDYTEGGAMQYSWHVLWDADGLAALHGGPKAFADRLGKLFADTTEVSGDEATCECSGAIGQFALGNEHDQHVPYLWQYAGRPDRAAETVRELCERYFTDRDNGLCGNDDCGQLSAWYVFACLGFYPVNPVGGEYVIGAPQVERVALKVGGVVGSRSRTAEDENSIVGLKTTATFTVIAKGLSKENKYVKAVTLNGKPLKGFIIRHADILAGGELVFEMTDRPLAIWNK